METFFSVHIFDRGQFKFVFNCFLGEAPAYECLLTLLSNCFVCFLNDETSLWGFKIVFVVKHPLKFLDQRIVRLILD